jgi:hypothetical protein
MSIVVLDPTLSPEASESRIAAALPELKGSVVGLLDNAKHNVDRFYDHLEEFLRTRYGVREFIRRRKPDTSRPAPPELLAELSACDAIISAVGD